MLLTEKVIIKTQIEEKIKSKIKNILENLTKEEIKKLKGCLSNNSIPNSLLNNLKEFDPNEITKILKKENVFFHSNLFNEIKEQIFFEGSKSYYYIGNKIKFGKGGTCSIYECFDEKNKKYALKLLNSQKRKGQFEKEINFLREYKHENVIELIDYDVKNYDFYIMPIYKMTLENFIEKIHDELKIENWGKKIKYANPKNYFKILTLLTNACVYFNEINYFHLDIKEDNILINEENGEIKELVISDFGCVTNEKIVHYKNIGNNKTMPPEYYTKEIFKNVEKYDIYSLGLVFNRVLTQKYPRGEQYKEISNSYKNFGIIDFLIKNLLFQEPSNRIDIICLKDVVSAAIKLYNLSDIEFNVRKPKVNEMIFALNYNVNITIKNYVHDQEIEKITLWAYYDKMKIQEGMLNLIKVKEIDNYKINGHCYEQMENIFIFDSWVNNGINVVYFYDFGNYILINKQSNYNVLEFIDKRKVETEWHSPDRIFFDDIFYNKKERNVFNKNADTVLQLEAVINDEKVNFLFVSNDINSKIESSLYVYVFDYLFQLEVTESILKKIINIAS